MSNLPSMRWEKLAEMLADRQKQNSSQLKQLKSLAVDTNVEMLKSLRIDWIVFLNLFFTALVWNRRQLKRQNADGAITGTSHIQRWQQPNIVHLKNFQSFKYYMKCDIQIPNSQSHVCLTYYIDDTNHIVSGCKLLFIKHDWNMKERNYHCLKRRNTRATPAKWAI